MVLLSHSRIPGVLTRRLAREGGPFGLARTLQAEMQRMASFYEPTPFAKAVYRRESVTFPKLNLASDEARATLTVELPGISPEGISVEVVADKVSISGARQSIPRQQDEGTIREERFSGDFRREVTLPFEANPAEVEASYSNGILTVTVPRAEGSKPRKITVKS